MEKIMCENCHNAEMEIDHETMSAHCPCCGQTYLLNSEQRAAISLEMQKRRTIQTEHEEKRKTIKTIYTQEEKAQENAFRRKAGLIKIGLVVGFILAGVNLFVGRDFILAIIALAATVLLFIPGMTDSLQNTLIIKGICLLAVICAFMVPVLRIRHEKMLQVNAKVTSSAENFVDQDFEAVLKQLKDCGFNNVETDPEYDLTLGLLKKEGAVKEVIINGDNNFQANTWFAKDAKIRIVYHAMKDDKEDEENTDKIKMPYSAKHYVGEYYQTIEQELTDLGFVNITTEESNKEAGILDDEGDIHKISIGGISDFDKNDFFSPDQPVRITYYPFTVDETGSESEASDETEKGLFDKFKDFFNR